ncbi:MAG: hypothetical protein ACREV7_14270 [Steroidobacteraceae bacterium]
MLAAALKRAGRKGFDDRSFLHPLQRLIASCKATSGSVLHLHYREIISDPEKTAARVFRHCGHASSRDATRRMRNWLGNRSNRGHRPRRCDLSSFGLGPNLLRAQFKPYTDSFDIELEWPPKARAARAPRY